MAAIRHSLQKSVFLPSDERLVGVVHVTKAAKKKKQSFLCAAVTTERPVKVTLYKIKKSEKGDIYKKERAWSLKDLKKFDGKDVKKDTAEFDLHFEKVYRWIASSVQEKNVFISCVYKLITRYLPHHKPEFENVAQALLIDASMQSDAAAPAPSIDAVDGQEYQALSAKEELDLEKLMGEANTSISNAEQFAEELAKDLSVLDGANLRSLMASEQQVSDIMALLERGILEADRIEARLDKYDLLLQGVKDYMESVTEKDSMINVQTTNKNKLMSCLDNMIQQLDLAHTHKRALLDGDLSQPTGLRECCQAALALSKAMSVDLVSASDLDMGGCPDLDMGLYRLTAVQDQMKLFDKLRQTFAKRLSHQLNNLIIHLSNAHEVACRLPHAVQPRHGQAATTAAYAQLMKLYITSVNKMYEREVRHFIETARMSLVGRGARGQQDVGPDASPMKKAGITDETRKLMLELFPNLETDLQKFLDAAYMVDGFFSLYMLVRVNQHVMSTQDSGSFLGKVLAACQLQTKRNFDKFMKSQIKAIEDAKVSKKTRCGIVSFVANFADFAARAEVTFKGSDRHSDLQKWFTQIVRAIFSNIVRIAKEHPKTPQELVMLENFHHMFSSLSRLKIASLENERKEAKQYYNEQLAAYVTAYLGRPLEKLNNFFDGVQAVVARGVKEEEVGYQLAYNKQELRKTLKEYPGKEVKKGLDNLYRKVEKHLCEEENLLQVVWRSMQEEFIRQYKHFEDLITRCYPGANITLDFTINDILDYFSNIAQQH
ncbi:PREDICTED: exocyst complex component 1-like [Priapulus caudatus]|uniref:Exocyst complex component 1-like n=1 Tax=Priapulus caudatus TaxID=37621 RepID=A0ABM1DYI1_PRICU|nr:PREDICTED: exocyst complex component 1-like [Priapulus caudatus]